METCIVSYEAFCRGQAEKAAARALVKMSQLEVQQYAYKTKASPLPKAEHTTTRFGDPEVTRMMSRRNEAEQTQRVETMNQRVAAM